MASEEEVDALADQIFGLIPDNLTPENVMYLVRQIAMWSLRLHHHPADRAVAANDLAVRVLCLADALDRTEPALH